MQPSIHGYRILFLQLLLLILIQTRESHAFVSPLVVVPSSSSQILKLIRHHHYLLHAHATNQTQEEEPIQKVSRRQQMWDQRIKELHQYNRRFGTYDVSGRHTRKNDEWTSLAQWLKSLRTRQGNLSQEKKDQLIALGVNLKGSRERKFEQKWEEMFSELIKYNATNGDTNVPTEWPENPKLANWVQRQRQSKKNGFLSSEREEKLRSIKFQFQLKESYEWDMTKNNEKWYGHLANLTDFYQEHGHFWPLQADSKNATIRFLGNWCYTQRKQKKQDLLSKDRVEALEDIGFPWDDKENQDGKWFANFQKLREILEEWKMDGAEGNPFSPTFLLEKTGNRRLTTWVHHQRLYNKKGTLDPKRKQFLDGIGFEWK